MTKLVIDMDDFLVEDARGNVELLTGMLEDVVKVFEEKDYAVCCGLIRNYLLSSKKLHDVAGFLNKSDDDMLLLLEDNSKVSEQYLDKIIEFLKLDLYVD